MSANGWLGTPGARIGRAVGVRLEDGDVALAEGVERMAAAMLRVREAAGLGEDASDMADAVGGKKIPNDQVADAVRKLRVDRDRAWSKLRRVADALGVDMVEADMLAAAKALRESRAEVRRLRRECDALRRDAVAFAGWKADAEAPVSIVTPRGTVGLPDFVRDALGVRDGGPIGFVRDHVGIRVLKHSDFLAACGIGDEPEGPGRVTADALADLVAASSVDPGVLTEADALPARLAQMLDDAGVKPGPVLDRVEHVLAEYDKIAEREEAQREQHAAALGTLQAAGAPVHLDLRDAALWLSIERDRAAARRQGDLSPRDLASILDAVGAPHADLDPAVRLGVLLGQCEAAGLCGVRDV